MRINRHDTNGTKPLLGKGELGYDDYTTGGDTGRVFVGTGTENIAQAKKAEVVAVDGKVDTHIARSDNPHSVTKAQVGLGSVDNTSDATKNVLSATKWTTPRTITLSGDVTGSVSIDGSANATITTTVAANSIALGTDTTGNYVAGNTAGTGITVTGTAGEGWSPTISIDSTVATLTGAQTLTNKTLQDSTTFIVDNTDATKKVQFDIAGVTTATTRTMTIPNVNGTLITTGDTGTVTSTMIADGTIVNADINASAAIVDTKLATISTAGKVSNSATTATNLNTASSIVARDASGNFNAGIITATLIGNSSTATALATGRTIDMTGDVTWTSAPFSGSANVTGTSTLATITDSGTGAFKKITTDTKGRVTGTQAVAQADITGLLGAGSITNAMIANTAVANLSGTNTGDQTITLTGDVTGSGTGSFATTLANSGVTAGTYSKVTVDGKGRVTAGLTPTMEDIPDATFKRSVRAATTANIALSAPQTIDGIALVAGDRVLVKDQTTASQNGIYVVVAGAWTRALDANTVSKIASALVAVDSGTVNGGKLFDNDFKTTDTLGTTAMAWAFNLDSGSLSSTTPLVAGTAAIGTGTTVARADHVHPAQTTITGNAGTATTLQTARTISGVSFNGSANIDIEDRLGTAIASAATTTVGTRGLGDYIHITGTTTITSFGTSDSAGIRRTLIFDGALTLTHNITSLICPGAANIVTVAGTVIEVIAETTSNWRVVSITHPLISMSELGYLDGVTSAIQTQLNAKVETNGLTVTDNAIARYDGTTGKVQNSLIGIDDSGNIGSGTQSFNAFGGSGFKNYIINGNFDVWQYATSQTTSRYGSDDRWANYNNISTKTHSQVACTDTEIALFNATYFSRTVATYVSGIGSMVKKTQMIEDITRLAGKTVTLSFWARANSNKKMNIQAVDYYGVGGTPSAYGTSILNFGNVDLTSTWAKYKLTATLPSLIGKTLGTNGVQTSAFRLDFGFTFSADRNEVVSYGMPVGQSGTFDIAQVQLEEGSVATPFENRPYGLELSLCQRYYQNIFVFTNISVNQWIRQTVYLPVSMRTVPTLSNFEVSVGGTYYTCSLYPQTNNTNSFSIMSSGGTIGGDLFLITSASAEL